MKATAFISTERIRVMLKIVTVKAPGFLRPVLKKLFKMGK